MAYTDHPGKGVQNRLYLRVITPAAVTIDGDVTAFPAVSNNVQRVHIDAPAAGLYTIEVHGIDVTHGIAALLPDIRQDFALAVINGVGVSPNPVDVAHVIDHSGSMGFYGYMEPAKERAKQLVDMLRVNDRTGVVAFDHTVTVVNGVVPIAGAATQNTIKTNIAGIVPAGSTSIGGGLQGGQAGLAGGGDPAHPHAIILLSDGHENTPPWVGGGIANSPPAWYGGPDFSEALPGIPATTRIYTVSLGVQSDQPLLQAIAAARGGTFHAINSPADIGSLHDLRAFRRFAGGEEVIGAGSDVVGCERQEAPIPVNGTRTALAYDLRSLSRSTEDADIEVMAVPAVSRQNIHRVPVDDTVSSVTFMVSWHDLAQPVTLTLTSPSGKVFAAGTPAVVNGTGSSYAFFRIESPEAGEWQLRVEGSRRSRPGMATYTWGAYGATPVGLRVVLPKKLLGERVIQAMITMRAPVRAIGSRQFSGTGTAPRTALKSLLEKHAARLQEIRLPFDPDKPASDPNLYRLAALDSQLRQAGKPSLFEKTEQRLRIAGGTARPTVKVDTAVPGTYNVRFHASGKTRKGHEYQRQSLNSLTV